MNGPGRVRVRIGTLRVAGGSAVEARRVTEALAVALERALTSWPDPPDRRPDPDDRVTAEVAARVVRDITATAPEVVR